MKRIKFPKQLLLLTLTLLLLTFAGRQLSVSSVLASPASEANRSHTPRIVGGEGAERNAWPWIVALVSADELNALDGQFCGAALVAPRWVMTAAHCLFDDDGKRLTAAEIDVVIGRHQLSASDGERLAVTTLIVHPSYDEDTNEPDIALLGLASASAHAPLSVISPSDASIAAPGTMATALGWGQQGEEKEGTDALHRINVPLVDNQTCNAPEALDGDVTNNMLCAGYAEGGVDTCYGDSGGPLVVPNATQDGWLQVGVVSWGDGCALPNKYGVYTRLANFNDWVQGHISSEPSSDATPGDDNGNDEGNDEGNYDDEGEVDGEGDYEDDEWDGEGDYDDDEWDDEGDYDDEEWDDEGDYDEGEWDEWDDEDGEWDEWYDEEDGEWYDCDESEEFCEIEWSE